MGKNDSAGRRRKSAQPSPVPPDPDADAPADAAFDVWLHRGLHQLYDDVAREPIPEELLRIIEADRGRSSGDPHPGVPGDGTARGARDEGEPRPSDG
jgi:hypothetical protein